MWQLLTVALVLKTTYIYIYMLSTVVMLSKLQSGLTSRIRRVSGLRQRFESRRALRLETPSPTEFPYIPIETGHMHGAGHESRLELACDVEAEPFGSPVQLQSTE